MAYGVAMNAPRAVSSPHLDATAAGRSAFQAGGNAVDAAIAAAIMLAVVYPHNCSPGGDVMALVDDGAVHAVNGSGAAPAGVDRLVLGDAMPIRGIEPITVPGAVSSWFEMAERWGNLPVADALEHAAQAAQDGVPVSGSLDRALGDEPELFGADPGLGAVFAPEGRPLGLGDPFMQPALAATLRRIAANGRDEFYSGATGTQLVEGLRALGSPIELDDLRGHGTEVSPPLRYDWGSRTLFTMEPNSQGFCLAQILAACTAAGLEDPLGAEAGEFAALLRESAHERDSHLADPAAMRITVDELLDPAHIAELVHRARANPMSQTARSLPHTGGDTVAVVASDGDLHVSLIQSVYWSFGSGILEPRTGLILHNRGAGFSTDPRSANVIAPGKRPLHTLMPVLVHQDGRTRIVAGTMGGKAQAQIHAQLLLRLAAGDGPEAAIQAPRMIVGDLEEGGDALFVEDDAVELTRSLGASGVSLVPVPRSSELGGHAQLIERLPDGTVQAASDPRADGSAWIGN